MNSNTESKTVEGEEIHEGYSELKTDEIGSVEEKTDLLNDASSLKYSEDDVTGFIGNMNSNAESETVKNEEIGEDYSKLKNDEIGSVQTNDLLNDGNSVECSEVDVTGFIGNINSNAESETVENEIDEDEEIEDEEIEDEEIEDEEIDEEEEIYEDAGIYDDAEVDEDAGIYDDAEVDEDAGIYEDAEVDEDAGIYEDAEVDEDAGIDEDEDVTEDYSESGTDETESVGTTDLTNDEGSQKCSAFDAAESVGSSFEGGDSLISYETESDVDDERKSSPTEEFKIMLEQVKGAVRNDEEKEEETEEDLIATKIVKKYRTACEKYKVFPLKECVENLDKGIIDLSDLNVGSVSFKPIVESLFSSKNLTQLILPNNKLGIDGLKWISYLFTISNRITHLDLENNFIGARGDEYIETILNNGVYLEFLDLSSNGLNDAQLIKITQVLNNTKLKELNLSNNNFRSESGYIIGQCLSANKELRFLDLSFNKFTDGAGDIFAGLQSNKFLKSLDLSSNRIGEDCTPELDQFLAMNNCLEELYLKHNFFTKECMIYIRKSLKYNTSLRILCLACNPILCYGALKLLMTLSSKKNKVEFLDLTGIRVNMEFINRESKMVESGRNLVVRHGHRLSCDTCAVRDSFSKCSMAGMIALANGHGVSLKTFLQEIHAKFFDDRRAQAENTEAEEIEKTVSTEQVTTNEEERYPRIKVRKFVQILTKSTLKVPEDLAQTFVQEFADDRSTVSIGDIILKIPLRYDKFEVRD